MEKGVLRSNKGHPLSLLLFNLISDALDEIFIKIRENGLI
jgi:hypothetical protein